MIDECSSEHWFKMDCCTDGEGLRSLSLLFGLPLVVGADELSSSLLAELEDLAQFHVDEHLVKDFNRRPR
jgi:hypothetical protein